MAADQQVIQSYLIKLGYSVDKVSQAAAEQAAGSTGKKVVQATSTIAAGLAGIVGLGAAATVSMNNLYYAAQRAGSSPLQFRAYTEAFSLIGGQADALSSTLQNIGAGLESSPAARFFGFALTGKDTLNSVEAIEGLIDKYNEIRRENPGGADVLVRNLVNQFATQLGADPTILRQILLNQADFRSAIAARSAALKSAGLSNQDVKDAAILSNQFKAALSDLFTALMKISTEAFPPLTEKLQEFAVWFKENPDDVRAGIDSIGSAFRTTGEILSGLGSVIGPVFEFFKWLQSTGLLMALTGAAVGFRVGGPMGALAGFAAFGAADIATRPADPASRYGTDRFGVDSYGSGSDRESLISKFQRALGITREQAAAIVGNLQAESGLNPMAINRDGGGRGAQGIAQWRGDRLAMADAFAGGSIRNASVSQQADFVIRELLGSESGALAALRNAQGLDAQVRAFRKAYERPGEAEANDSARLLYARQALGASAATGNRDPRSGTGQSPYVLSPNVNVTINGAGSNAREIGSEVEFGLRRMYADWNRNLSTQNTPP